jgi:surfactin synthase thioesterase subunit
MTKTNVFFIPFAGGNRYSFREYFKKIPPALDFIALEYPGRGMRMNDALLTDVGAIVNDLYSQIRQQVGGTPYAIFGHSMGALVAFLLARKLSDHRDRLPKYLFLTGTSGPSAISRNIKQRHQLGREEFIHAIREMGGLPDEILANEELLEYFEPILRADFTAVETYRYAEARPLNIPMTIVTGTDEEMSEEDISLWQQESVCRVKFQKLPGGHFFVLSHVAAILEMISLELLPLKISNYER